MTRPDDSLLSDAQLATVRSHAEQLLREASAHRRFPTPVDDLLAAAKLTVVDDQTLNEEVLKEFLRKVPSHLAKSVKSALGKVLGLLESKERLIVIDRGAPKARIPFIKLHEAGHDKLPHQRKMYRLVHDCEGTLDPDITDLFEREANVFASEVLFQGKVFAEVAGDLSFGIKAPIQLAHKFGASNYSTFRRYVRSSLLPCGLVVLNPVETDDEGEPRASVRRLEMSKTFERIYDRGGVLSNTITISHPLSVALPSTGKRMARRRHVWLLDRGNNRRVCLAEAFDSRHQIFVLLLDIGAHWNGGRQP